MHMLNNISDLPINAAGLRYVKSWCFSQILVNEYEDSRYD